MERQKATQERLACFNHKHRRVFLQTDLRVPFWRQQQICLTFSKGSDLMLINHYSLRNQPGENAYLLPFTVILQMSVIPFATIPPLIPALSQQLPSSFQNSTQMTSSGGGCFQGPRSPLDSSVAFRQLVLILLATLASMLSASLIH